MAVASIQRHRVPWGGEGMCSKREGPCRVQGPRSPGPGPGGPSGVPPYCTRPAATPSTAPVARQNRPGPSRGVSHMPGVPPTPQSFLPHAQVQDWSPAACLPPTTAPCPRPGIRPTMHRHWLRPPPASGPGQGLASVARKKVGGDRASGRGCSGPWVSSTSSPGPSSSSPTESGPGRSNPRHVLSGWEPQVCRFSITKLRRTSSASRTKASHCLPEAQGAFSCPKEAGVSRAYSPKVAILIPEPRRRPGAPPPNPTLPSRPLQISGSPRNTLKGWLAGGQVSSPALNPGNPLWSLLSPG
jgi:hypothetical protein